MTLKDTNWETFLEHFEKGANSAFFAPSVISVLVKRNFKLVGCDYYIPTTPAPFFAHTTDIYEYEQDELKNHNEKRYAVISTTFKENTQEVTTIDIFDVANKEIYQARFNAEYDYAEIQEALKADKKISKMNPKHIYEKIIHKTQLEDSDLFAFEMMLARARTTDKNKNATWPEMMPK